MEIHGLILKSPVAGASRWRHGRLSASLRDERHFVDLINFPTRYSRARRCGAPAISAARLKAKVIGSRSKARLNQTLWLRIICVYRIEHQRERIRRARPTRLTARRWQICSTPEISNPARCNSPATSWHGNKLSLIGELRGCRSCSTTLTGLILRDARRDERRSCASSSQFTANGLASGAKVNGITASDLRVRKQNDVTTGRLRASKPERSRLQAWSQGRHEQH